MKFFAQLMKKNVFLGVDIGTSSIKAVELSYKDQKAYLTNYGSVTIRDAAMDAQSAPAIHKAISALLQEMRVKATRLYVSLPSSNGLVALLEFPFMSEKELEQAVRFEAHKYIPAEMEDIALSWEVIQQIEKKSSLGVLKIKGEKEEKKKPKRRDIQEVLLVAALKSDVGLVTSHFKKAQYDIHAIELESFSLVRSLAASEEGDVLIIDIGHSICNFALASNGIVRISRNIDVGGRGITETIADSMNVSAVRADAIKKGKENLFRKKEFSLVFASLDVVLGEAQRIISSYEKKHGERHIEKVVLSGGTAGMMGINEFFEERLQRKVERGNCWRHIEYDKQLSPYIQELDGSFSVAIGLALRGVDDFRRGM